MAKPQQHKSKNLPPRARAAAARAEGRATQRNAAVVKQSLPGEAVAKAWQSPDDPVVAPAGLGFTARLFEALPKDWDIDHIADLDKDYSSFLSTVRRYWPDRSWRDVLNKYGLMDPRYIGGTAHDPDVETDDATMIRNFDRFTSLVAALRKASTKTNRLPTWRAPWPKPKSSSYADEAPASTTTEPAVVAPAAYTGKGELYEQVPANRHQDAIRSFRRRPAYADFFTHFPPLRSVPGVELVWPKRSTCPLALLDKPHTPAAYKEYLQIARENNAAIKERAPRAYQADVPLWSWKEFTAAHVSCPECVELSRPRPKPVAPDTREAPEASAAEEVVDGSVPRDYRAPRSILKRKWERAIAGLFQRTRAWDETPNAPEATYRFDAFCTALVSCITGRLPTWYPMRIEEGEVRLAALRAYQFGPRWMRTSSEDDASEDRMQRFNDAVSLLAGDYSAIEQKHSERYDVVYEDPIPVALGTSVFKTFTPDATLVSAVNERIVKFASTAQQGLDHGNVVVPAHALEAHDFPGPADADREIAALESDVEDEDEDPFARFSQRSAFYDESIEQVVDPSYAPAPPPAEPARKLAPSGTDDEPPAHGSDSSDDDGEDVKAFGGYDGKLSRHHPVLVHQGVTAHYSTIGDVDCPGDYVFASGRRMAAESRTKTPWTIFPIPARYPTFTLRRLDVDTAISPHGPVGLVFRNDHGLWETEPLDVDQTSTFRTVRVRHAQPGTSTTNVDGELRERAYLWPGDLPTLGCPRVIPTQVAIANTVSSHLRVCYNGRNGYCFNSEGHATYEEIAVWPALRHAFRGMSDEEIRVPLGLPVPVELFNRDASQAYANDEKYVARLYEMSKELRRLVAGFSPDGASSSDAVPYSGAICYRMDNSELEAFTRFPRALIEQNHCDGRCEKSAAYSPAGICSRTHTVTHYGQRCNSTKCASITRMYPNIPPKPQYVIDAVNETLDIMFSEFNRRVAVDMESEVLDPEFEQCVSHFPPARQAELWKARESLRAFPLSSEDFSALDHFVKSEKGVDSVPRSIINAGTRVQAAVGPYLRRWVHAHKAALTAGITFDFPECSIVMRMPRYLLDIPLGAAFDATASRYDWVMEDDGTRFDCQMDPRWLERTRRHMFGRGPNTRPELSAFIRNAYKARVKVRRLNMSALIYYENMGSGKPDTTTTNSEMCFALHATAIRRAYRSDPQPGQVVAEQWVAGDDGLTFSRRNLRDQWRQFCEWSGYLSEVVDNTSEDAYRASFCSNSFVPMKVGDRVQSVACIPPGRMLAKASQQSHIVGNYAHAHSMYHAYFLCTAGTASQLPVARACFAVASRFTAAPTRMPVVERAVVCPETWDWMTKRYGLTQAQLLELEAVIDRVDRLPCFLPEHADDRLTSMWLTDLPKLRLTAALPIVGRAVPHYPDILRSHTRMLNNAINRVVAERYMVARMVDTREAGYEAPPTRSWSVLARRVTHYAFDDSQASWRTPLLAAAIALPPVFIVAQRALRNSWLGQSLAATRSVGKAYGLCDLLSLFPMPVSTADGRPFVEGMTGLHVVRAVAHTSSQSEYPLTRVVSQACEAIFAWLGGDYAEAAGRGVAQLIVARFEAGLDPTHVWVHSMLIGAACQLGWLFGDRARAILAGVLMLTLQPLGLTHLAAPFYEELLGDRERWLIPLLEVVSDLWARAASGTLTREHAIAILVMKLATHGVTIAIRHATGSKVAASWYHLLWNSTCAAFPLFGWTAYGLSFKLSDQLVKLCVSNPAPSPCPSATPSPLPLVAAALQCLPAPHLLSAALRWLRPGPTAQTEVAEPCPTESSSPVERPTSTLSRIHSWLLQLPLRSTVVDLTSLASRSTSMLRTTQMPRSAVSSLPFQMLTLPSSTQAQEMFASHALRQMIPKASARVVASTLRLSAPDTIESLTLDCYATPELMLALPNLVPGASPPAPSPPPNSSTLTGTTTEAAPQPIATRTSEMPSTDPTDTSGSPATALPSGTPSARQTEYCLRLELRPQAQDSTLLQSFATSSQWTRPHRAGRYLTLEAGPSTDATSVWTMIEMSFSIRAHSRSHQLVQTKWTRARLQCRALELQASSSCLADQTFQQSLPPACHSPWSDSVSPTRMVLQSHRCRLSTQTLLSTTPSSYLDTLRLPTPLTQFATSLRWSPLHTPDPPSPTPGRLLPYRCPTPSSRDTATSPTSPPSARSRARTPVRSSRAATRSTAPALQTLSGEASWRLAQTQSTPTTGASCPSSCPLSRASSPDSPSVSGMSAFGPSRRASRSSARRPYPSTNPPSKPPSRR